MRDSEAPANRDRPLDLGVFSRAPAPRGPGAVEVVALLLGLGWLAAVAAWFLAPDRAADWAPAWVPAWASDWQPSQRTASVVLAGVAVVLPLGFLWLAALTARHLRQLWAEADRLRAMLDALRQAQIAQTQLGASVPRAIAAAAAAMQHPSAPAPRNLPSQRPDMPPRAMLAEVAAPEGAAPADGPMPDALPEALSEAVPDAVPDATAPAAPAAPVARGAATPAFASRRDPQRPPPPPPAAAAEDQPALALGTPPIEQTAPVPVADFVRALNFPESPEDAEGFRALRRALDDRSVARLVRAAQDVLTLLSQDGIYMDDLAPDRARPEVWRRFAAGERGRAVAALGGVRDRDCLAAVALRMRQDTVFRDAAHHFLRHFDRSFAAFAERAGDAELAEFADTRTARAFMLIGRAAGTFD